MGIHIGGSKITAPTVVKTTDNLSAYELYLKARPSYLDRSRLDEAEKLLVRAIELDPEYADAWEMRAALQLLMGSYGYSELDMQTLEQFGLEYANKTLELNPNSSLATATIGNIYFNMLARVDSEFSIEDVFEQYDKALKLEPRNETAILWNAIADLQVGNTVQAEKDFGLCLQIEPRYAPCFENYMVTTSITGKDKEAFELHLDGLNKGLIKIKYSNFGLLARVNEELAFKSGTNSETLLLGWNRHDELWKAFQNLDADHTELGRDILNFVKGKSGIDYDAISMLVYPLGVYDIPLFSFMIWDPSYRKYRQTNEFKAYIKFSGIFEYWKKNGFPNMCKPIGANAFECS